MPVEFHQREINDGDMPVIFDAGLAFLDAHIDTWKDLKPGVCVLRWFLIPRLVKAMIK